MIHRGIAILSLLSVLASMALALASCGSGSATPSPAVSRGAPTGGATASPAAGPATAPAGEVSVPAGPAGAAAKTPAPTMATMATSPAPEETATIPAATEDPAVGEGPDDDSTPTEAPEAPVDDVAPAEQPGDVTMATPEPTHGPPATTFSINQTETCGDFKVTVNRSWRENEGKFAPEPGMEYLVLEVTVENVGSGRHTVNHVPDFELQDKDGQRYTWSLSPQVAYLDGPIAAGEKITGDLAYEVPAEAKGLILYFRSSQQPDGKVSFDISQ